MGGVVLPSAGGIFFLAKRQELLYAYMRNVKPYGEDSLGNVTEW